MYNVREFSGTMYDSAIGNPDNTSYLFKDLSTDVLRRYPCKRLSYL